MTVTVTTDVGALPALGHRAVPAALDFETAPPGMPGLTRFDLTALDDAGFLFALRSADDPGVRLFVVPPRPYFPDYAPGVPQGPGEEADDGPDGAAHEEPVLLVVVHPGQDGAPPTANLLAPIVVDPSTGHARQVVLDGDQWPLRAPLTAASPAA